MFCSGGYTQRNLIKSNRNQIVFTIFFGWFGTKQESVWFQINQKMVNTIWYRLDLTRFRKDFSVCILLTGNVTVREAQACRQNGGLLKSLGTILQVDGLSLTISITGSSNFSSFQFISPGKISKKVRTIDFHTILRNLNNHISKPKIRKIDFKTLRNFLDQKPNLATFEGYVVNWDRAKATFHKTVRVFLHPNS